MTPSPREWDGRTDAERLLRRIASAGGVIELRALMASGQGKNWIDSGYFDDINKLVAAAERLDVHATGVFVTLNDVDPALLARAKNRLVRSPKSATSDTDIVRRRWLLIDIDPVRPSGISASDAEKAAAVALAAEIKVFLAAHGFSEPLDADSGNGHHLVYATDLARDDGGLVERVLQALAFRFDTDRAKVDTSVHNPARLTKLYGTMVRKGDSTPDRPHRRSRILSAPESPLPVAEDRLRGIAAMLPKDPPKSTQPGGGGRETLDIDALLARAGVRVARRGEWKGGMRWVFEVCPFNNSHTNGSAYLVQLASGAVASGCHHSSCQGKGWRDLLDILDPDGKWRRTRSGSPGTSGGAAQASTGKKPRIIPAYMSFPTHLLPKMLRGFVECVSTSIGCDPAMVALPALAVAASAIGNTRRVRLKHGWSEPSILWVAVVVASGRVKTPPLKVVQYSIEHLQRQFFDSHALDLAAYDEDLKRHEIRYRDWVRNRGEGAIPKEPERPVAQRLFTSDPTMEALAVLLLDRWRGLVLARDELSGWLASFDQYRSGSGSDVAYWLQMHGGGSITIDRKTGSPKHIFVPRASVSIAGCIQPAVLSRALGAQHFENGLAARFLLVSPPRRQRCWTDAEIPTEQQDAFTHLLERLYALSETTSKTGERIPVEIDLSLAAKKRFVQFFNEHGAEQFGMSGELAAAWSKLEGYAPRLALVHHCLRWADHDPTVREAIDEESMSASIELARWFGNEARRVYCILGESEAEQEERDYAEMIRMRGGSISLRDWQKLRGHRSRAIAEEELSRLAKVGYGDWMFAEIGPKGGRPTKRFALRPEAQETETPDGDDAGGISSEFLAEEPKDPEKHDSATDSGGSAAVHPEPEDLDPQPAPEGSPEVAEGAQEAASPSQSLPLRDSDKTPAGDVGSGVSEPDLSAAPFSPPRESETGEMFRDEDSASWGVHDA